uniref:Uncharacterized protein n=1 Tax=Arundo donax TaxID=35708 RepID=A0A0A9FGF1_ARUDO
MSDQVSDYYSQSLQQQRVLSSS